MEETKKLAEYLCKTSYQDIPVNVREHAKLCILDCLGVTLAATKEKMAEILVEFVKEMGGNKEATILGKNVKTSVLLASLVNGTMSHALDFDDVHIPSATHPSVCVLPPILAVAESKKLGGKDLLTAFILGFEVLTRIGMAVGMSHYDRGLHSTATMGHFGAATGVGKLLNLKSPQMINALGIAGTQAAGIRQMFGTMCKPFHSGKAGMNGVMAAYLASKGFTSVPDIIEGKGGFLEVYSENPQREKILTNLGDEYQILAVGFKLYASCRFTHAVIDGMKIIRNEIGKVNVNDIEEIEVEIPKINFQTTANPEPRTGLEGKFSVYYCATLALLEGEAGEDKFTDEKVNEPQLVALRKKVKAKFNESQNILETRINVKLRNGKSYFNHILSPKGEPENPVNFTEIEEKFKGLVSLVIPKGRAIRLVEKIKYLEEVVDIKEIIDLCRYN